MNFISVRYQSIVYPALLLSLGLAHSQTGAIRIRILSYNTHHGQGTDGRLDLQRIAAIVNSINPDYIGLQEIDSATTRTGGVNQAAEYGRLIGMNWVFGRAIPYGGGAYGNATLCDRPFRNVDRIALPGSEPRMALITDIDLSGGADPASATVTFINTHLMNGEPAAQLQGAVLINNYISNPANGDTSRPMVLVGDMNASRGSPPISELLRKWNASAFNYGIDWILFRPANRWRFLGAAKVDTGAATVASDHLPVFQDMELLPLIVAVRMPNPASRAGGAAIPAFRIGSRILILGKNDGRSLDMRGRRLDY